MTLPRGRLCSAHVLSAPPDTTYCHILQGSTGSWRCSIVITKSSLGMTVLGRTVTTVSRLPYCKIGWSGTSQGDMTLVVKRNIPASSYLCPLAGCPSAFAREDTLKKQMKRHSGERTRLCPWCVHAGDGEKTFADEKSLKAHYSQVHCADLF